MTEDSRKVGCIFCGGSPTTKEHIFPKWASEVLKEDPRGLHLPFGLSLVRDGVERTWEGAKEINYTANCVCRNCNEGWMNEVEERARAFVAQMIRGDRVWLSRPAQKKVAAWCALRSIMARYGHSPVNPVEKVWRDWLYQHRTPPDTWYVWLTSYHGEKAFHYKGHDVNLSFEQASETGGLETLHGVLATFIVGYLAFKVLGIYEGIPTYPGPKQILRIWPVNEGTVEWPTLRTIIDSTLPSFEDMFVK